MVNGLLESFKSPIGLISFTITTVLFTSYYPDYNYVDVILKFLVGTPIISLNLAILDWACKFWFWKISGNYSTG